LLFTYVSEKGAGSKTLAWGTAGSSSEDIYIEVDSGSPYINGIILHDGDLTITDNCSSTIPFNGIIIVSGNLTIEGDIKITTDKDIVADIVIQNYLGTNGYVHTDGKNSLGKGDLLGSFVYDDSGSTYIAIEITDRGNIININDLVAVTDWKKSRYSRL